jgi:lysophospholipase L1-like esterase
MQYAMALPVLLLAILAAEFLLRVRHRTLRSTWPSELCSETQAVVWDEVRDRYRIVCLGDSNTFGEGLPSRQAFPALLEAQLREKFPQLDAVVINAGIRGNTAVQGLARLTCDVLRFKPHVVVSAFGANDGNLGRWPLDLIRERQMARQTTWSGRAESWLEHSHLYQTLRARMGRFLRQASELHYDGVEDASLSESQPRVSVEGFVLAQRLLVGRLQAAGCAVFLMTTTLSRSSFPVGAGSFEQQMAIYQDYDRIIREVAAASSSSLIDLQLLLKDQTPGQADPLIAPDAVHLTTAGHRAVAAMVLSSLEQSGLLHSNPDLRR